MSEENSSSSAMNEHIEEGDERDERHEQDSRQQSCSKTNEPELDSQALLSVLATMQANMTQTNRFLARLFNENDSAASQLKRKRELDSPLENNDALAGSSIVAYSGSKRIRRDSVQSVNYPEDPVSSDMSATASEKSSNEASEKADSEKASEKACNVAPERAQPTAVSFSVRSAEDDALSLCGGNDFGRENESDDEDPDNEELLTQIDGAYGHLDETGPPISEHLANVVAKKITTDYDLDQRKEILSKYKTPQNCDELYVPRINPEIWEKLKPFARKKDIKVSVLQDILVKVTSAISLVTDDLLQSRERKLKPNYQVLISRLIDSVALLGLPWIRVAVEKPTAGPGRAKEEGRRGRLWSPWTSLSGTAPIRINIQNLDVGFHWFISDRSREITHSLLCNLLSGRSPTNQSTQV